MNLVRINRRRIYRNHALMRSFGSLVMYRRLALVSEHIRMLAVNVPHQLWVYR